MRLLRRSSRGFRPSAVLPVLSLVRSAADLEVGHVAKAHERDCGSAPSGAGRLDGVGARRAGLAPNGKRRPVVCADWPGAVHGVRAPEIGETPLSDAEWPFLFRGDLE